MSENKSGYRTTVLLSIHHAHAENIFAGVKTLELRKNFPKGAKFPVRVLMYETNAGKLGGGIVGEFTCPAYMASNGLFATMAKRSALTEGQILQYANGGKVYGWVVKNAKRYASPVPLSEVGIERAPQSWRYLVPMGEFEIDEHYSLLE